MDWRLELVIVPVADVDRAKAFYVDLAGFELDVDHRSGDDFRVVQLTPRGSRCSISLMEDGAAAGSVRGLHLVVDDIERARSELVGRGIAASEFFHFGPDGPQAGLDPERSRYGSYFSFSDPDGTAWLVQEVRAGHT